MDNNELKVVVKAGFKPAISLKNCYATRVVMAKDLEAAVDKTESTVVIVEHIQQEEKQVVNKFIKEFKGKSVDNMVLFLISGEEENNNATERVAIDNSIDILRDRKEVYRHILNSKNVNVSPLFEDIGIQPDSYEEDNADSDSINVAEILEGSDFIGNEDSDIQKEFEGNGEEGNDTEDIEQEEIKNEYTEEYESHDNIDETGIDETGIDEDVIETPAGMDNTYKDKSEESPSVDISTYNEKIDSLEKKVEAHKKENSELSKSLTKSKEELKAYRLRVINMEGLLEATKQELQAAKDRFESIVDNGPVMEDPITLSKYKAIMQDCEKHLITIKKLEGNIESSKRDIDRQSRVIKDREDEIKRLEDKLATERQEHLAEIEDIKYSISTASLDEEKIEQYERDIERYKKSADVLRNDNARLGDKLAELAESTNESLEETRKYKNKLSFETDYRKETVEIIQHTFEKLKESNENLEETRKHLADTGRKLDVALKSADNLRAQNDLLNKEIVEIQEDSKVKDSKIAELQRSIDSTSTDGSKSGVELTELDILRRQLENASSALKEKEAENERLRNSLSSSEVAVSTGVIYGEASKGLGSIAYGGNASLITVVGGGNHGVTTTAMSLVNRIGATSNVVYVDLDIVYPSGDAWFRRPPICSGIPGVNPKDRKNSALGLFFNKGAEFILSNLDKICINIETTRGGRIDYLSGIYYDISNEELVSGEYTKLLEGLGDTYEYIVVDAGRIGGSNTIDSIIRCLSDISFRTVVVSTPSKFDVRATMNKVRWLGIDTERVAWLFNMCMTENKIEKLCIDTIGSIRYGSLTYDNAMREMSLTYKYKTFTAEKNNPNTARFDMFLNNAIFKR